ncbi:MAG: hypothetical protein O3C28_20540 [Proteobacteria bacterium]|nr:hypothetical protein [Pseudomonadota bacterium]
MNKLQFVLLLATVLSVTACGKQEPEQSTNSPSLTDAATPPQPSTASSANESDAMSATKSALDSPPVVDEQTAADAGEGTPHYVDHNKDKVEFALKRSLAGAQSLLEDVKDPDQASKIEQQIAALQAELDAL